MEYSIRNLKYCVIQSKVNGPNIDFRVNVSTGNEGKYNDGHKMSLNVI